MRAGVWYEGVTGWREIVFWILVMAGILAYTWWTHGNRNAALVIIAFLGLFLEFDLSTRQIERLMRRTEELEHEVSDLKKSFDERLFTLKLQANENK
jgi:chemotaxis signal transduction protein